MQLKKETVTRGIHWGFACFIFIMLGIGFYMTNSEYSLETYEVHKSLGVIFFILMGIRLYWRVRHPWQSLATQGKYGILVHYSHVFLLGLLCAMPITGLLSSGFSGWGIYLFDWELLPQHFDADGIVAPVHGGAYKAAKFLHMVFAYSFTGLILIHISAVLKHHFFDRDDTLIRMLKGK
jgi:cytochrome b561